MLPPCITTTTANRTPLSMRTSTIPSRAPKRSSSKILWGSRCRASSNTTHEPRRSPRRQSATPPRRSPAPPRQLGRRPLGRTRILHCTRTRHFGHLAVDDAHHADQRFGTLTKGVAFESDDDHNPFLDRRPARPTLPSSSEVSKAIAPVAGSSHAAYALTMNTTATKTPRARCTTKTRTSMASDSAPTPPHAPRRHAPLHRRAAHKRLRIARATVLRGRCRRMCAWTTRMSAR